MTPECGAACVSCVKKLTAGASFHPVDAPAVGQVKTRLLADATRQNSVRSSIGSRVVATAGGGIGGALRAHFAVGSRRAVRSFDPTYGVKPGQTVHPHDRKRTPIIVILGLGPRTHASTGSALRKTMEGISGVPIFDGRTRGTMGPRAER